ncbi:MAG: nickel-dependent hydrogenase large subunit [Proteobacteria bacterium]|nr:nickel-dependent hydrogenase large subunit [Pseudomonadota bacterium]
MIEGQINIDVFRQNSIVTEVKVTSSRPLHAAQLLLGKTPEQALTIVPLLFNICGIAHAYNARKVLHLDNHENDNLYKLLVLAETLKEHLLRIFLDTPKLLAIKASNADLPFISQIVNKLKGLILSKDCKQSIKQFIDEIEGYLKKHVFKQSINQWLKLTSTKSLLNWAKQTDTISAQSIAEIHSNNWQHQGHSEIKALPKLPAQELLHKLNDNTAKDFIAYPTWNKQPHETTPLTRQLDKALMQDVLARYNGGLLARWLARLLEIAQIPSQIRALLTEPTDNTEQNTIAIAQVEAARGRLIHRAEVTDNIIQNYQIVAPTEWNFHPRGLIVASLQNINTNSTDEYSKIAHLMINSIDPCVGYQLRVMNA